MTNIWHMLIKSQEREIAWLDKQSPEFRKKLILEALRSAKEDGHHITMDNSAINHSMKDGESCKSCLDCICAIMR